MRDPGRFTQRVSPYGYGICRSVDTIALATWRSFISGEVDVHLE